MKLTKDEARLISILIEEPDEIFKRLEKKEFAVKLANAINDLTERLEIAGKDHRRYGRTSQNDFSDLLKRFVANYEKNK